MPISKILFSFQGRIGRQTFWMTWVGLVAINVIIIGIVVATTSSREQTTILGGLWLLTCWWAAFAVQAKRWHDRDKSGWMVLINFIPVIGILWTFVELVFFEGTLGPNRYGEDPLQPRETSTEEAVYDLLAHATRLECHGRVEEALAAYDDIARRYGHTAVAHDAQKSAESLRAKVG